MDPHGARRERLAGLLPGECLDALLVSNPVNVTYLTGFSGDSSNLVLARQRALLVSDGRFTEQIAEECPGLEVQIRPTGQTLPAATAEALGKLGVRSVGFESGHLSVAEMEAYRELAPTVDWKPGRDRVEKLRAIKDASEVAEIREAIRIAEKAFAMFRAMLRPDDREKDLSDALEMYIRRAGGKCSSFPSIVAGGPRSALAHAPPSQRTAGAGGLLLVDWGASGRFYKSDLTRVLIPRNHSASSSPPARPMGEPGDGKLEEVYAAVLTAQEQALHCIRPGVKAHDVDAAARSAIAEAGFGSFFIHGLGHGLGLQVHESPALRTNSQDVLAAGMVVTVEPGIYLPGWGGIRIEDDVLVTPDGYEVLSSVPKDLAAAVIDW
jgi:Xaa-Pro aminopeptidase